MLAFFYVLLGHLQSDPIEARFGWLRQLSGANHLMSMKQVLDSDKKIRTVSLKFSGLSLQEIDEALWTVQSVVSDQTPLVEKNYCFNGHDIKAMIVKRLFNCLAKNFVRQLSNSATQQPEQTSRKRKIAKLSGASAQ